MLLSRIHDIVSIIFKPRLSITFPNFRICYFNRLQSFCAQLFILIVFVIFNHFLGGWGTCVDCICQIFILKLEKIFIIRKELFTFNLNSMYCSKVIKTKIWYTYNCLDYWRCIKSECWKNNRYQIVLNETQWNVFLIDVNCSINACWFIFINAKVDFPPRHGYIKVDERGFQQLVNPKLFEIRDLHPEK